MDASVLPDVADLVAVVVGIDRWLQRVGGIIRADESEFIEVSVGDGGHAVTVHGSRRVQLDLHADRVAEVGELHGAGDAAVQLRIDVHDVRAAREREVGLLLEPSYVLRDQQRCANETSQPLVRDGT